MRGIPFIYPVFLVPLLLGTAFVFPVFFVVPLLWR